MEIPESDAKFLAGEIGLCWHEWEYEPWWKCKKCGKSFKYPASIDFTSEHGFFVAWNWAKEQEWWQEFLRKITYHRSDFRGESFNSIVSYPAGKLIDLIGPTLIPELVKFLQEREEKKT